MSDFTKLNASSIVEQIRVLSKRIEERFPHSGLYKVSKQVYTTSKKMEYRQKYFSRPNYWIRALSISLIALIIIGLVYTFTHIKLPGNEIRLFEFFQAVEAGINDVIFIGVAIYFLSSLEAKLKRRKVLKCFEELRSLIHIIDMHQLSKDP